MQTSLDKPDMLSNLTSLFFALSINIPLKINCRGSILTSRVTFEPTYFQELVLQIWHASSGLSAFLIMKSLDHGKFHLSKYLLFILWTAYLMAGMPRSYISDRKWSLSYLGQVPHYEHVQFMSKSCSKLAQFRGYDHFVLRSDQCYSSHALPANVYKKQDLNAAPDKSQRDFNVPYFLKGMSKLFISLLYKG